MTLRAKLLLAQAPLAAALALLGIGAVSTINTLGTSSQTILKDNYRSVIDAERMKNAIDELDRSAIALATGRPRRAAAEDTRSQTRFVESLRDQQGNVTEVGEQEATDRLTTQWSSYEQALGRFWLVADQHAAERAYVDTLEPLIAAVKSADDTILALNEDAMIRKSEAARSLTQRRATWMMAAIFAALLLGIASTTSLTSRLLGPLMALSAAVRRLGEGDTEARARVVGQDEIADLAREFNTMATRLARYQRSSLGELLQAQQSSQAVIDSLTDPVVIFGERGEVLNVNRAASDFLGIVLEVGTADPLQKAPAPARDALIHVRTHVLGGKGAYTPRGFEDSFRVPSPQGERCFLPRGSPVYAEEGGVMGAAVLLQDVTRLIFFDQFKNDVVATVAHEFRTPLTSLRMAVHLCAEGAAGPITEKQADLLFTARDDCERLQKIVDDLLDVSRIQSGRFDIRRVPTSAQEVLRAADELHDDAEARGLSLTISDETVSEDRVAADQERIRLVVTNLVQNAIRHAPPETEVRVRAVTKDDKIRFEVSDSGPGVPSEYQARIFEKYFQVPDAPSGGAGLGLYISREIVLAHDGDIGVESAPGEGSTFWFALPKVATPTA